MGRALRVARHFADDDCRPSRSAASWRPPPAPRLQQLAGGGARGATAARVARHRPVDALAAAQLAGALRRNKVYMLSRLDPSLVEDLDVVPIASADELRRLAGHHASCLLIPNAPCVTVVRSKE